MRNPLSHSGKDFQDERLAFLQLCSMMLLKKGGPKDVMVYIDEDFEVC